MDRQLRLFYSYSHEDEALRARLEQHLSLLQRQGILLGWHDRKLLAGANHADEVDKHLESADIILFLISPGFIHSDYLWDREMRRALERHDRGEAVVLPILTRPVDWQDAPFAPLLALPRGGQPVTAWQDQDEAWAHIAREIRRLSEGPALLIGRDSRGNPGLAAGRVRATVHPQFSPRQEVTSANPYLGLSAFAEEDAPLFFGREKLTARLWGTFRTLHESGGCRLLSILGPSGSGKSSVMRAGLVPELLRRPLPTLTPMQLAVFTPGPRPLDTLGRLLARILTGDPAPLEKGEELSRVLARPDQDGQYEGLRKIGDSLCEVKRDRLIILIDQFEETYTQCQNDWERAALVDNLITAGSSPNGSVSIILTLRSDFFGHTRQHPALNRVIAEQAVLIPMMSEEDLRRAISEPARQAGRPLSGAIVDLLLREASGREGALPLLEFALARIWEGQVGGKAPEDTLRELSGVGGALAGEADGIYARFGEKERRRVRQAFLSMVQLGEGAQDTRRRVAVGQLIGASEDRVSMETVLRQFAQPGARLVTLSGDAEEAVAEVTHEALFQHWGLLRQWIEAAREDLRFHRRLEEAALRWEQMGRPDGSLWRPPELDLLRQFGERVERVETDLAFSNCQLSFLHAAIARQESEEAERNRRKAEDDERARRERRRTQRLAGFFAAVALALGGLGLWAIRERHRAEVEGSRALIHLAQAYQEQGRQELLRGERLRALLYLSRAYSELRSPEVALRTTLAAAVRAAKGQRLVIDGYSVNTLAVSPDGAHILTVSEDRTIRLWNARTGTLELAIPHALAADASSVSFSPDGTHIVVGGWDQAEIWDLQTRAHVLTLNGHKSSVASVAYSPDGTYIVTGSWDKTARVWDARTGQSLLVLQGHTAWVESVAFSPDGQYIVTGSRDDTAQIWDARVGRKVLTLKGNQSTIHSVAYSPDGESIVTGGGDGTARIWGVGTGKELHRLEGHRGPITAVAYSPNGEYVVTGSWDRTVRIWGVAIGRELYKFEGHERIVHSVAFSPDGASVVSGSLDKTVRIWSAEMARELLRVHWDGTYVHVVAYSPDGSQVLTANLDSTVRVWDAQRGTELLKLEDHQGWVNSAVFSPDGKHILTGSADGTARVWDSQTGEIRLRLRGHKGWIHSVAYGPDGKHILTGGADETARVWDSQTGQEVRRWDLHGASVNSVAYHPDGVHILTEGAETTVWDGRTGGKVFDFRRPLGLDIRIRTTTYSPDGRRILVVCRDGTAQVWDSQSGDEVLRLEGPKIWSESAAYSTDGKRIVTGDRDGTVRLWDSQTGNELLRLDGHRKTVTTVAFSHNGARVISGSEDGSSRIWDVTPLDFAEQPPTVITTLVRCRVPFQIDDDGQMKSVALDVRDCPHSVLPESPWYLPSRAENLRFSARRAIVGGQLLLARDLGLQAKSLLHGLAGTEQIEVEILLAAVAGKAADLDGVREHLGKVRALSLSHSRASWAVPALLRLADAELRGMNDADTALADLARARELGPEDREVLVDLAEVRFLIGQFDAFFQDLPKILATHRGNDVRVILSAYAWAATLITDRSDLSQRAVFLKKAYADWFEGEKLDWAFDRTRQLLQRSKNDPQKVRRILDLIEILDQPRRPTTDEQLARLLDGVPSAISYSATK